MVLNRNDLLKVIENSLDQKWEIITNDSHSIIFAANYEWISWNYGKQLTIIFSNEKILINCISFGRGNCNSPFHWFANRKVENKILAEFLYVLHNEKNNRQQQASANA